MWTLSSAIMYLNLFATHLGGSRATDSRPSGTHAP